MSRSAYVPPEQNRCIFRPRVESGPELDQLRSINNPKNLPTGPWTGRCPHCGSDKLWDDNLAYGCTDCGAILGGN